MATVRKFAGLIAAILLTATGGTLLLGGVPLVGGLLVFVGIAAAVWQIRTLVAAREDPYDLSRLFDAPLPGEDKPTEDFVEEDDAPFCHHCGHAVAKPLGRCPECGSSLR